MKPVKAVAGRGHLRELRIRPSGGGVKPINWIIRYTALLSRWKAMLKRSSRTIIAIYFLAILGCRPAFNQVTPTLSEGVRNGAGMQLRVVEENTQPTLRIVLPGQPASDRAIEVLFPEHVTVRPRGSTDASQIYLFQPGQYGERPLWRQSERALE